MKVLVLTLLLLSVIFCKDSSFNEMDEAKEKVKKDIAEGGFPPVSRNRFTRQEYIDHYGREPIEVEGNKPDVIDEFDYECINNICEPVWSTRVLVLGGTQFIGRRFVESLLKNNTQVTILNSGETENPFGKKVRVVKADRWFDPEGFEKSLDGLGYYDAVVDFSGLMGGHVLPTVKKLIGKIGHYIYVSCSAVNAINPKVGPSNKVKERTFEVPSDEKFQSLALTYTEPIAFLVSGKVNAENLLLEAHEKYQLATTIIRLPDVVGPHDNKGRHLGIQLSIDRGIPIGSKAKVTEGSSLFSLVYVDDVVKVLYALVDNGPERTNGKIINVAGDETFTIKKYATLIAKELDKKTKF